MPKSDKNQPPRSRDPKPGSTRTPYSKPELENLGSVRELTRLPGGSINTEGSSGKPHKQ
jgi:hypothetical protein